ncbi:restriction endonuclease subunit S [Methanonatronarchaeum sp. AMET-Sl]|nr:restriction endonuclease subunit S [Methanonatronarchaeum sp. AMET-Sl]WGI18164.1 restriction endonuclease subunit S [Methanonatronarchaeum sp. AMET-Sl]
MKESDLTRKTVCGIPPSDWPIERLSEVVRIVSGNSLPTEYQNEEKGQHPVYKVSDMNKPGNQKYVSKVNNKISKENLKELNHDLYPKNTTILPKVGAALLTNKRRMLTEPSSFDNNIMGWIPQEINPEFLYYLSCMVDMEAFAQKGAVPSISKAIAQKLKIPSPPISEQRKIASVLYNVDQAIQKTQEIIEQTKQVKKGLMQDLFTEGYYNHKEFEEIRIGPFTYRKPSNWNIKTIKEAKDGENGLRRGPFGSMLKKEIFVESGYKVYQQQNAIYEDFKYGDYYITKDKFDEMKRFSVEAGDLLISCSGTLGKIARVPEDYEKGVINQALLKFSVDEDIFSTAYMKYFLQSNIGQRQLVLSSRGSAIKNMAPMGFIKCSKIFQPSKEEQEKISDTLLTIDEKIDAEENRKKQLQRLKKGLMQDLLTGEVRTKDREVEVVDEVVDCEC